VYAKATVEAKVKGFEASNGLGEAAKLLVDDKAIYEAKVKGFRLTMASARLPNCSWMTRSQ
jgi:hypothetical protein